MRSTLNAVANRGRRQEPGGQGGQVTGPVEDARDGRMPARTGQQNGQVACSVGGYKESRMPARTGRQNGLVACSVGGYKDGQMPARTRRQNGQVACSVGTMRIAECRQEPGGRTARWPAPSADTRIVECRREPGVRVVRRPTQSTGRDWCSIPIELGFYTRRGDPHALPAAWWDRFPTGDTRLSGGASVDAESRGGADDRPGTSDVSSHHPPFFRGGRARVATAGLPGADPGDRSG